MNKPEFGNYNNILWEKLFNNVDCEQITKYYSNWTINIDINKECYKYQQKSIHVESLFKIQHVNGIAINKDGHILVSDWSSNCIRIFDKNGKELYQINGTSNGKTFDVPSGIAIKPNGEIIIADCFNNRICLIKDKEVTVIAGNGNDGVLDGPGDKSEFSSPSGLAIHPDGTIFVTDSGNNCIRAISTNYNVSTIAGPEVGFDDPRGIAIQNDNTIIIADTLNHRICAIDINKKTVSTIAGSTKGHLDANGKLAKFNNPFGIAIMKDQTIIISDRSNYCIRSININYDVKTIAGSKNSEQGDQTGLGFIAKFNNLDDIVIDVNDNIFVPDNGNKKIYRLYYK
jgi:DNA-binding beta-propeller fold protein YncE